MFRFLFAAVIILGMGCKMLKSIQVESGNDIPSLAGKWSLHSIIGAQTGNLFPSNAPYLEFDSTQQVLSGSNGCNRLSGKYKLNEEQSIELGPLVSTKMACPDAARGERIFMQTLQEVDHFSIQNNELVLQKNKQELLRFERAAE